MHKAFTVMMAGIWIASAIFASAAKAASCTAYSAGSFLDSKSAGCIKSTITVG